jgi:excisionase family DNA binding protein
VSTFDVQRASTRSISRLALTAAEAAEAIGVSEDFFAEHVAAELRFVRRGRKKLVSVRELERWLDENAARVFDEAS